MTKVAHICTSGISHKIMGDKLRILNRQDGFEVTFISSPEGVNEQETSSYPFDWRLVAMERSIKPIADLRSIVAMYRLFRRERYDIVHTHTAKAGIIGRVAAKLAGVPVIIHTSHGLPFYEGQSKKAFYIYRLLEKVGALCCHSLASQNMEDAEVLRKLVPWRPVFIEGNGVDKERLDLKASLINSDRLNGLRLEHDIAMDKPVLLMAARFESVKDHFLLLEALLEIKHAGSLNWVTVLAGQGPMEASVKRFIADNRLDSDIVCIGQQSSIIPWIVMADAVTLTSEKEGIPRSLMEAMALAKPIVATDVLGTRELVEHGETGMLVPYRNAKRLSGALEFVMNSPQERDRLGEAGRLRIEAEFTEDRVVERLKRMYRETGHRANRSRKLSYKLQGLVKRLFDIVVSVPAALVLLPVLAIIGLLVRMKLGSPILFKQERPGRFGNLFHVLKFRTMRDAVDKQGEPLPDEARLTPFGSLLRKLSVDELPQLFNVILGDMSLVGPRPLLKEYLPLYTEEQSRRHDVRPGITGWAQVNGRNTVSWEDKFQLDTEYVERQSFWFDIQILMKTVMKVLKRDGISQQGQATVHKFTGNREMGSAS